MKSAHLLPSNHILTAAGPAGVAVSSGLMTSVASSSLCASSAARAVLLLSRRAAVQPHITQTQTKGQRENTTQPESCKQLMSELMKTRRLFRININQMGTFLFVCLFELLESS